MLIGVPMTKDQIIEKGMDVMVQLIKFDVEQNDIQTTLRLNVLGVIYDVFHHIFFRFTICVFYYVIFVGIPNTFISLWKC